VYIKKFVRNGRNNWELSFVYINGVFNMRRKSFLLILGLAVLLSAGLMVKPKAAFACSCAGPLSAEKQVQDELERKTAIFAGKVTEVVPPPKKRIMSSADEVKVTFEVTKVWKGELGRETVVYTAQSSASCGYENFEVGTAYIVSAYNVPEDLHTNICDLTKPLDSAGEELALLGDGYLPSDNMTTMQAPQAQAQDGQGVSLMSIAVMIAAVIIGSTVVLMIFRRYIRAR